MTACVSPVCYHSLCWTSFAGDPARSHEQYVLPTGSESFQTPGGIAPSATSLPPPDGPPPGVAEAGNAAFDTGFHVILKLEPVMSFGCKRRLQLPVSQTLCISCTQQRLMFMRIHGNVDIQPHLPGKLCNGQLPLHPLCFCNAGPSSAGPLPPPPGPPPGFASGHLPPPTGPPPGMMMGRLPPPMMPPPAYAVLMPPPPGQSPYSMSACH